MSRKGRFGKYGEVKRKSRLRSSRVYRGKRFGSKARLTGNRRRKSHKNKYSVGSPIG